jgi:hypothetical protein
MVETVWVDESGHEEKLEGVAVFLPLPPVPDGDGVLAARVAFGLDLAARHAIMGVERVVEVDGG